VPFSEVRRALFETPNEPTKTEPLSPPEEEEPPDEESDNGPWIINAEAAAELDALEELTSAFRFNDAVIRHMVMKVKAAITAESPLLKKEEDEAPRRDRDRDGGSRNRGGSRDDAPVASDNTDAPAPAAAEE
jgi:hypothetical protein